MSTEPFVGEIKIFGFDFAPKSFEKCNGQFLAIQTNTALFSLLGTMYGGDGRTTFALPDLRSRIPIGTGRDYIIGETAGVASRSILISNMPAHTHPATGISINVPVSEGGADTDSPINAVLANTGSGLYAASTNDSAAPITASGNLALAGSSMPTGIENPYLAINYSIALYGIFPSRN